MPRGVNTEKTAFKILQCNILIEYSPNLERYNYTITYRLRKTADKADYYWEQGFKLNEEEIHDLRVKINDRKVTNPKARIKNGLTWYKTDLTSRIINEEVIISYSCNLPTDYVLITEDELLYKRYIIKMIRKFQNPCDQLIIKFKLPIFVRRINSVPNPSTNSDSICRFEKYDMRSYDVYDIILCLHKGILSKKSYKVLIWIINATVISTLSIIITKLLV